MKLPYRARDSFALPLGNGESAPATILACHHRFVDIAVADRELRVFDDALVLHRWQVRRGEALPRLRLVTPGMTQESSAAMSPARAERTIAAALGVASFDDATRTVHEMHDDVTEAYLAALPSGALLAWGKSLSAPTIEHIRNHVATRAGTRLRLQAAAAKQAPEFASFALQELTLAGPCTVAVPFAHVRELTLDTPLEQRTLAELFPKLTTLRISAGARHVDLRAIARVAQLEHLDLSHVSVVGETLEYLAPLRSLRALRLARLDELRLLRGLDALTKLRTLSIEHLHLDTLAPLPLCTSLEQLELLGMWQFTIEDAAWLHDLPRLVRAEVDIGGRRKNLELYRRARWAHPWPTF